MVEFCRSNPAGLPVTVNPRVLRHSPPFQSGVVVPTSRYAIGQFAPAETGKRTLHESKYLPVFPVSCRYKPSWADRPSPCERRRDPRTPGSREEGLLAGVIQRGGYPSPEHDS